MSIKYTVQNELCTFENVIKKGSTHLFARNSVLDPKLSLFQFLRETQPNYNSQVKMKKVMQELKPVLLMVLVQLGYASTSILLKFAINDGMSIRVIVAYRHIFGAALSCSLALFFERCSILNPVTCFV